MKHNRESLIAYRRQFRQIKVNCKKGDKCSYMVAMTEPVMIELLVNNIKSFESRNLVSVPPVCKDSIIKVCDVYIKKIDTLLKLV